MFQNNTCFLPFSIKGTRIEVKLVERYRAREPISLGHRRNWTPFFCCHLLTIFLGYGGFSEIVKAIKVFGLRDSRKIYFWRRIIMAWVSLIVAGVFEMFWATMMKMSEGFSKLNYSLLTIVGMIASFYFLSKSLHSLPMSLAYPIWTGIGAVGSILIGVFFFKDHLTILTSFFVILLVVGIIGIKVTSGH